MKPNRAFPAIVLALLFTPAGGVNRSAAAGELDPAPQSARRSATDRPPPPTSGKIKPEIGDTPVGAGPVIDGVRFTVRQIVDRQQGGIPVAVFIAPDKWRDQSQVVWNYAHSSSPVKLSVSVENPANEELLTVFPAVEFFCLRPDAGFYKPGQNIGGYIYTLQPMPPAQALLGFIQQTRGNASKLQVVGSKDLPELPAALKMPSSPNQRGVGVKVTYALNGKPVEEEFYAVHYTVEIPYDGPQGRTWQINWGFTSLHSFRAPEGALDGRRPVFAAIAKSFRPNPAWRERLAAINAYLQQEFNRQLQAGYDQIAAAVQLSRQISANNDAMLASIDRQLAASRSTPSGTTGRSANDKFSDYIRGVDTVDDPYYGTSQHASTEKFHWTDGYGSYRNSNDPTANPSQTENGNWQLMTPAR